MQPHHNDLRVLLLTLECRCVSDSGMGSCFSEDVAKYVPFCNKDAASKKADQAKLQPSAANMVGTTDGKVVASACPKYNASTACDQDDSCNCGSNFGLPMCVMLKKGIAIKPAIVVAKVLSAVLLHEVSRRSHPQLGSFRQTNRCHSTHGSVTEGLKDP
eukprot:1160796-Pelagomonas_calceolata.AAC.2